jgi:hypothetical protein
VVADLVQPTSSKVPPKLLEKAKVWGDVVLETSASGLNLKRKRNKCPIRKKQSLLRLSRGLDEVQLPRPLHWLLPKRQKRQEVIGRRQKVAKNKTGQSQGKSSVVCDQMRGRLLLLELPRWKLK